MELSMNNRQLKKALENFSNGHKLGDVAQFSDIDVKVLKAKFRELGVVDEDTARDVLSIMKEKESLENLDGGKWDKGGQVETPIKVKKPEYLGTFNRNEIVQNSTQEKEIIPLAEQHRFRKDFTELSWGTFAVKWMELLNLSEKALKEQVKKFAPARYNEVFAGELE